ncbi:MAG: DUF1800 domain-containing protein [Planctomycetales bacterium]
MANSLAKVDPAWAWNPYHPDARRPWNRRAAAHLARRAGFGATWSELEDSVRRGPRESVQRLFSPSPETAAFETEMDRLARTVLGGGDPAQLSAWWFYRILKTPRQLVEKTVLFWHGHFATSAAKVESAALVYRQHQLLRKHAWGRFEDMVQGISRDPAMLIWLDSTTNRKTHPNENYARELMELFCLGVGAYTEKDIQEIARTFTGWEVRRDKFYFTSYRHDRKPKTFLGRTGDFGGEDAVRIVLAQPAAPRFIARKLIHFFMFDEPSVPDSLLDPLAAQLRENDFRIQPVLETILGSNLFFSEHSVARKVRSPVELATGLLRSLEGTFNTHRLAESTRELGQGLFYPPNVKGWDGGRTWINSSTLLGRANLARQLALGDEANYGEGGLDGVVEKHGVAQPERLVDWLSELLLAAPLPKDARSRLVRLADSNAGSRAGEIVQAISLTPEFQLG